MVGLNLQIDATGLRSDLEPACPEECNRLLGYCLDGYLNRQESYLKKNEEGCMRKAIR